MADIKESDFEILRAIKFQDNNYKEIYLWISNYRSMECNYKIAITFFIK